MASVLTFIIPVRHQDNARHWPSLKKRLADTVASIERQECDRWEAVIVANRKADLPRFSRRFEVKWVDYPPNELHEKGSASREDFYDAFRIDKGRRVLEGLLHARPRGHVMVVDDDDFVSRRLTSFVARNPGNNGWYVKHGYVWSEGSGFVYCYSDFSFFCGTSHIIRADLYETPSEVSADYVRRMLGAHVFIREHLESKGKALAELPFRGAVYRVGHSGAHSQSGTLLRQAFLNQEMLKRPLEFCRRLFHLRPITASLRKEFFAE